MHYLDIIKESGVLDQWEQIKFPAPEFRWECDDLKIRLLDKRGALTSKDIMIIINDKIDRHYVRQHSFTFDNNNRTLMQNIKDLVFFINDILQEHRRIRDMTNENEGRK